MQKLSDRFIDSLVKIVPLSNKHVLEIGSGDGTQALRIRGRARFLHSIDSDITKVRQLREKSSKKLHFSYGSPEALVFPDSDFDVVIFSQSFSHVGMYEMHSAIEEAVRVVKSNGYIVFLELVDEGTFADAEIMFDAGDGDRRFLQQDAYEVILTHPALRPITEYRDLATFKFFSFQDFVTTMKPKKNLGGLELHLKTCNYILRCRRRINIFQPR